jgi:hypothetical protein
MKRAYYNLSEDQLLDAVMRYGRDLRTVPESEARTDKDGAFIQGPADEVLTLMRRIRQDIGPEPVYVEDVDSDSEDVSLSDLSPWAPAPEEEADDVSFGLEA